MEDPTPPLDTPGNRWLGRLFEGPKSIDLEPLGTQMVFHKRFPSPGTQGGIDIGNSQHTNWEKGGLLTKNPNWDALIDKWVWVKHRYLKWDPGKCKQRRKPAAPWWLNFVSYPNIDPCQIGLSHSPSAIRIAAQDDTPGSAFHGMNTSICLSPRGKKRKP